MALGGPALPALACSCSQRLPVAEEVARADVVFTGRVLGLSIESGRVGRLRYESVVVRFVLRDRLKGVGRDRSELKVVTGSGGPDCGYPFELGDSYLVYANLADGRLFTGVCRRNRPLVEVREKTPGKWPLEPEDLVVDREGERETAEIRALLKLTSPQASE